VELTMGLPYAGSSRDAARDVGAWERAGLDMVWVAEAYGLDAFTLVGYLAAITERLQIATSIVPVFTRTPTLLAMSAAGADDLSGGRFQLGIGASGPQVIEGWHGVVYDAPIGRTREAIDICRTVWRRDSALVHDGRHYQLPLPADRGTGLGKPLKLIGKPIRNDIPIWVAALGTRNVEMAAELADGWLPAFLVPDQLEKVWGPSLRAGAERRDPERQPLCIAAGGVMAIGEFPKVHDVRESARPNAALYIGGMGARGRNFYNDLVSQYGYEREAAEIQDQYLNGNKRQAAALVPDALLEAITLCGPPSYLAERIAELAEVGITHLKVNPVPVDEQTTTDVVAMARELCDA
jgi:F420-dependent oxidoreductase-like protein